MIANSIQLALVILGLLTVGLAFEGDKNIRRLLPVQSNIETENQLRAQIDAKIAARTAAVQEY